MRDLNNEAYKFYQGLAPWWAALKRAKKHITFNLAIISGSIGVYFAEFRRRSMAFALKRNEHDLICTHLAELQSQVLPAMVDPTSNYNTLIAVLLFAAVIVFFIFLAKGAGGSGGGPASPGGGKSGGFDSELFGLKAA
jgi:hypothetical protein